MCLIPIVPSTWYLVCTHMHPYVFICIRYESVNTYASIRLICASECHSSTHIVTEKSKQTTTPPARKRHAPRSSSSFLASQSLQSTSPAPHHLLGSSPPQFPVAQTGSAPAPRPGPPRAKIPHGSIMCSAPSQPRKHSSGQKRARLALCLRGCSAGGQLT